MRFFNFKELDSTNDFLKNNIKSFREYDIITAQTQTKGKARRGNIWFSNVGMALFSFLIDEREGINSNEYLKLPLISGLATIRGLKKVENLDYMFKWTNDVYLNGKKLSGILIEKVGRQFIVGIGINVNNTLSPEIKNVAVCLKEHSGKQYDITCIISSIVEEFSKLYDDFEKGRWKSILNEINSINYLKNSPISIRIGENPVSGIARNINDKGEIEVLYNKKIHTFSVGEILKERVVVEINKNPGSYSDALKLKKLGYDIIAVYFYSCNSHARDDLINFRKAEKFAETNKIKFEKIYIKNTSSKIVLLKNLYKILQKYNTSYIYSESIGSSDSVTAEFKKKYNLSLVSLT